MGGRRSGGWEGVEERRGCGCNNESDNEFIDL